MRYDFRMDCFAPAEVTAASALRERSEIPDRFKWNLSHIFPSWDAWKGAFDELDAKIDAYAALQAKQIDAIVIDLPTAFYMTAVQIPNSTVVGQFPAVAGGEHYGMVLDKGSSLTPCVDKALAALKSDGTLAQLTKTWLSDKVSAPILQ